MLNVLVYYFVVWLFYIGGCATLQPAATDKIQYFVNFQVGECRTLNDLLISKIPVLIYLDRCKAWVGENLVFKYPSPLCSVLHNCWSSSFLFCLRLFSSSCRVLLSLPNGAFFVLSNTWLDFVTVFIFIFFVLINFVVYLFSLYHFFL